MDQQLKQAKLKQFSDDKNLQSAVYEVLQNVFLKKKSGEDVQMKAARFIAVELLQEGQTEMTKYASGNKPEEKARGNPGL